MPCPSIICPLKLTRDRRLTEGEARANKFLQLVRSPVERAISRLHRFRILKYCPHGEAVTNMMVLVACAADSNESAQVPSQWVHERATASPRQSNLQWLHDAHAPLEAMELQEFRGHAAGKRKRGAPGFKRVKLTYEGSCKRCKQPRTRCTCGGRGRGRGRARRRAAAFPAPVSSSESSSSDETDDELSSGSASDG